MVKPSTKNKVELLCGITKKSDMKIEDVLLVLDDISYRNLKKYCETGMKTQDNQVLQVESMYIKDLKKGFFPQLNDINCIRAEQPKVLNYKVDFKDSNDGKFTVNSLRIDLGNAEIVRLENNEYEFKEFEMTIM